MDETVHKSCWGITVWAVVGFACVMLMAYLFVGGDPIAVVAAG